MADIRRTVGLLDGAPTKSAQTTPEPGIDDVGGLVADFQRAGLDVALRVDGPADHVSAAVGLALYRITQESLANIAKHAPDSKSTVSLCISATSAGLTVENRLPVAITARCPRRAAGCAACVSGSSCWAGPSRWAPPRGWSVRADIPLHEGETGWRPWWCKA